MKNRIEITADEFCSSVRDGTHDSPKEVLKGGKPLVTTKHLRNGFIDISSTYNISNEDFEKVNLRSKVDKWDVLISMIGTVGEVFLVSDEPDYAIKNLGLFKIGDEINSKWLFYYLKSQLGQNQIKLSLQGSTQQYISLKSLRNLLIYVPETEEETKSIVSFLSLLDKKIELNQQMNEALEEIAKVTFKSWFIDFDPVKAKAEGRPTGLSKEISDLFPDSFEDSELGKIPKNYKVGKLEELAKYLNRGVSPSYVENNGVYLVNQKCIRNGKIDFNLCKQSKEKSSMNERYLEKYDILLNSMGVGTLGRVAMFYEFDKKITADALVTIIKGESVGSSFFIYYFLERMEDYLNTISVGSTGQTSLKKEDILDLQMTIPPKNLLDEFGIQLSMFAEKKHLNNQENLILRDLRDALLPKLISGELKVSDAENLIEEASIK